MESVAEMIRPLLFAVLVFCPGFWFAFDQSEFEIAAQERKVLIDPALAAQDPEFQVQGEYVAERKGMQVIALGGGNFRAVLFNGGLPGAGWDKSPRQEIEGNADDMADLAENYEKIVRKSPTLDAAPPEGSLVLFDGTPETFEKHWKPGARLEPTRPEGSFLLMEGATTSETFDDYTLHLEFLLSFMPEARGQGRANSGAYHQGRYETQILDSFGLEGKDNECGGLYKIKAPDVNACFPPLSWQTYDVEVTSARYDESGKKIKHARITARLNGILIHDNVELPTVTVGNSLQETPQPGPLFLQNHGNPIRFRNIWILPRDAEEHARRPRVPGFERFYARADQDAVKGGTLLLGELNCTACHAASAAWSTSLLTKQSPRLSGIGSRVRPESLRHFVLSPQGTKPGSGMPQLLAGLSEAERTQALEPIVHFLASTGKVTDHPLDRQSVSRGEILFHSVGCAICHGPAEEHAAPASTSVPLGPLSQKYVLNTLRDFLKNPQGHRPAARMPALHLDDKEATDLAHYLLREAQPHASRPQVEFQAYHGSWQKLPDFSELQPVRTGQTTAFQLNVAGKSDQFGLVFSGWFTATQAGRHQFHLGSDDGSRLLIDDVEIVRNDGIHPHSVQSGMVDLSPGPHRVRVEYFEQGGEESLSVDVAGPGIPRQDLANLLRLTEQEQSTEVDQVDPDRFVLNPALIARGQEQFVAVGCAACHEMKVAEKPLASTLEAPPLEKLNPARGCLAETVPPGLPRYGLSREQRLALRASLSAGPPSQTPTERLQLVLTAFNCYACHERDRIGGPEISRNEMFLTNIPEMGDEGRLPPPLTGVADKLQPEWLKRVLQQGARDRPYMQTRMPRFDHPDVTGLLDILVAEDQRAGDPPPALNEPEHRIKAMGQELVSATALACIKCHTFAGYPATGIQAISLTSMHQRLREDWFLRYLADPARYRPGTRMPNSFPNGISAAREILSGKPAEQIAAMWTYLKDGEKAGIPAGLLPDPIELQPAGQPIVYRNFIEGVSPRGIAVGYPERANLTWDADQMCLKLIWHGPFIDAGRHWRGRGQGAERPLGRHLMTFEQQAPWVLGTELDESWPAGNARERGFRFQGYQLDESGRPAFLYKHPQCEFREELVPLPKNSDEADLKRIIHLKPLSAGRMGFVVAAGEEIELAADRTILLDKAIRIELRSGGQPVEYKLVEQGNTKVVLYEFDLQNPLTLEQTLHW